MGEADVGTCKREACDVMLRQWVLLACCAWVDGYRLTRIPPDFALDQIPPEPRGRVAEFAKALIHAGAVGLRLYNEQRRSELHYGHYSATPLSMVRVLGGSRQMVSAYKQVFNFSVTMDVGLSDCPSNGLNHLISDEYPCEKYSESTERHYFELRSIGDMFDLMNHKVLQYHGEVERTNGIKPTIMQEWQESPYKHLEL